MLFGEVLVSLLLSTVPSMSGRRLSWTEFAKDSWLLLLRLLLPILAGKSSSDPSGWEVSCPALKVLSFALGMSELSGLNMLSLWKVGDSEEPRPSATCK